MKRKQIHPLFFCSKEGTASTSCRNACTECVFILHFLSCGQVYGHFLSFITIIFTPVQKESHVKGRSLYLLRGEISIVYNVQGKNSVATNQHKSDQHNESYFLSIYSHIQVCEIMQTMQTSRTCAVVIFYKHLNGVNAFLPSATLSCTSSCGSASPLCWIISISFQQSSMAISSSES